MEKIQRRKLHYSVHNALDLSTGHSLSGSREEALDWTIKEIHKAIKKKSYPISFSVIHGLSSLPDNHFYLADEKDARRLFPTMFPAKN